VDKRRIVQLSNCRVVSQPYLIAVIAALLAVVTVTVLRYFFFKASGSPPPGGAALKSGNWMCRTLAYVGAPLALDMRFRSNQRHRRPANVLTVGRASA
jgi:hypothetical protein